MHNCTVVNYQPELQWKTARQASTHKEGNMNALSGCKMQEPLCCGKVVKVLKVVKV